MRQAISDDDMFNVRKNNPRLLKNIQIPKKLYNLNINSSDIPNSNFKGPF